MVAGWKFRSFVRYTVIGGGVDVEVSCVDFIDGYLEDGEKELRKGGERLEEVI